MKIIKIFGVVVAVHAAVFLFIFAIPGCRSTGRPAADEAGAAHVSVAADAPGLSPVVAAPAAPVPAGSGGDRNPVVAPAVVPASVTFNPDAPATVRQSPTRPGSVAAAGLTPAPAPAPAQDAPATAAYTVVKGDSLWSIAQKHKVTVHDLATANNLPVDSTLRLGQKLIVPGAGTASPRPAAAPAGAVAYTVKSGDSLDLIARHHGTTSTILRQLNNLKSDTVRAGQTLQVPAGAPDGTTTAASSPAGRPAGGDAVVHVVKAGETLGAIARIYSVPIGAIATANNIADPKKIRPGQELKIPDWQRPGAKAAPAAEVAPAAPAAAAPVDAVVAPPAADSPIIAAPPAPPPADGPVIKVESSGAPAIP